jgi:hypothetical protein
MAEASGTLLNGFKDCLISFQDGKRVTRHQYAQYQHVLHRFFTASCAEAYHRNDLMTMWFEPPGFQRKSGSSSSNAIA